MVHSGQSVSIPFYADNFMLLKCVLAFMFAKWPWKT